MLRLKIALALAVCAALTSSASPAQAKDLRADCPKQLRQSANYHRAVVVKRHGNRAAGRDIVRDGRIGPNQRLHRVTRCGRVRRYRDQLIQLHTVPRYPTLRRIAVPPARPPAGVKTPSVDGTEGSGGWAIPEYIVMCESGGNYNASNPSGAYGAYQIMPGTAQAYGCDLSTPAGQDRCAARIYAAQGASPWVCG
jgi:hypothetical protein